MADIKDFAYPMVLVFSICFSLAIALMSIVASVAG
jgi:hypothetical protein